MEQKLVNKILIVGVVLSCLVSIGLIIFVLRAYQKEATVVETKEDTTPITTQIVDSGPVSFVGFVGKPVSTTVGLDNGNKIIELRGHTTQNTNKAYESVLDTDMMTRRIIINPDTQVRRITQKNQIPEVNGIEFNELTSAVTTDVYIASYEAKEGEEITETTPAHSIVIFAK
ncbi:MAG: hypothetical protein ACD_81C00091G0006 [uncultured bacterium]|uniref:Uncharacterized protein n=1 Tax=Candidatus Wolfebacteria bacterium GW2011_GWE2_44_13 TaxID=1619017 RepID=A0A0G1HAB9_9BACT|nr:MAG: hypothetical protein ACD_81C00091G0006 [uncultured bacterium]KKT43493.1 MAG: hypothetical protein UW32_C0001G0085 [Candidatus Wolfebacteria bacterium GW2011_GWE2_44_13]